MGSPGRPTLYSEELAGRICERLSTGETLRAVCRDDDMPAPQTVLGWAKANVGFSEQYARARETGYHVMADEILEIADETAFDTTKGKDGSDQADTEWITRSRLRVDTRKWLLSKALPKIYGDKQHLEHSGEVALVNETLASMRERARRARAPG